jgi:hypothetical protein
MFKKVLKIYFSINILVSLGKYGFEIVTLLLKLLQKLIIDSSFILLKESFFRKLKAKPLVEELKHFSIE